MVLIIIADYHTQAPLVTTETEKLTDQQMGNLDFQFNVTNIASKMTELFDLHNTVMEILEEEGENATIEMKALSVILNKTLQHARSWVRIQL